MSSGTENDINSKEDMHNMGPNCSNFIAGIIEGILNSSKMDCQCTAHFIFDEEASDEAKANEYADDPYAEANIN